LAEEHGGDGKDLGEGIGLAKDAGVKLAPASGRIKQGRNQQNTHIPAEDQHSDGDGHQLLVHQHEKQRAEEQLVGYRVEIGAEHGALLEEAREHAIEGIGETRGYKKAEAERIVALKDGRYQERRKADARQRKQIGSAAKRIQS